MPRARQRTAAGRWRILLKLALIVVFVLLVNYAANWLIGKLDLDVTPANEHVIHRIIIAVAVLYAILIAIPFVPGVEIGLSLIMVLGADLAFLVYIFTILGLTLSFFLGRLIPQSKLQRLLAACSLTRASELVGKLEPLDPEQRLELLLSHTPSRFIPFLLRHRYVAVALALNIPGNALIGGGGGISMVSGLSRIFGFVPFVLMLAVAVSPVPLLIMFFGTDVLS